MLPKHGNVLLINLINATRKLNIFKSTHHIPAFGQKTSIAKILAHRAFYLKPMEITIILIDKG
jgi:hypothetical protein